MESRTNMTPKPRSSWWRCSISWVGPSLSGNRFSGYIRRHTKGWRETVLEGPKPPCGEAMVGDPVTWALGEPVDLRMTHFISFCSFQNFRSLFLEFALLWVL
jgi:hypothetical protein